MSFYSSLFKSAKKAGGSIIDLSTGGFKSATKKVVKSVSSSATPSRMTRSVRKAAPSISPKGASKLAPSGSTVRSTGGVFTKRMKRTIIGAGTIAGSAALVGTGINKGVGAVKDVFDPVARSLDQEAQSIDNLSKYYDVLSDAQDAGLIPAGGFGGSSFGGEGFPMSGEEEKGGSGLLWVGLAAAGVGAYFLLRKKKKSKKSKK